MSSPPPPDDVATVLDVVEALEELVGGGRRLPFTGNVVVNEDDILELVDRIRVTLPDDLMSARHTLDEREQLLDRAQREAEDITAAASREAAEHAARAQEEGARLVHEAQARAAALIDEHAIVRSATEHAQTLVAQAEQAAAAQRSAADDYARDVMRRLEEQLERWIGTVREGLQALPAPAAAPPRRQRRRGGD